MWNGEGVGIIVERSLGPPVLMQGYVRDMNQPHDERALLREAVRLARQNADRGEQPFGALVVRDGRVIGTGVSTILSDGDPTAHAEVAAVRDACVALGTLDLGGATIVCSCEPCPMCHAAAVIAGVSRIIYSATKETAARHGFALTGVAADMQATWRAKQLDTVEHVPIEGADEPFARFDEGTRT
jgi:guanine deaminase